MKKIIAITILFILSFGLKSKAQKAISVKPLQSFALDSDFDWLSTAFKDKLRDDIKIVGLGEVSHGATELFQFKAKMIQYLVVDKKFREIYFEYPDAALYQLNNYLTNNDFEAVNAVKIIATQAFASAIRDQSLSELFVWIKKYNLLHPTDMVKIIGVDVAGAAGSFANYFMLNYAGLLDLSTKSQIDQQWKGTPIITTTQTIIEWCNTHDDKIKSNKALDYRDFLYKKSNAEQEINYVKLSSINMSKASAYRDSIMAVNILALKPERSIFWTHNLHASTADLVVSCANYLKEGLGANYYSILTDFSDQAKVAVWNNGKYQEKTFKANKKILASVLNRKYGIKDGIVFYGDIVKNKWMPNVGFLDRTGNYYFTGRGKGFDALVYFEQLSPVVN